MVTVSFHRSFCILPNHIHISSSWQCPSGQRKSTRTFPDLQPPLKLQPQRRRSLRLPHRPDTQELGTQTPRVGGKSSRLMCMGGRSGRPLGTSGWPAPETGPGLGRAPGGRAGWRGPHGESVTQSRVCRAGPTCTPRARLSASPRARWSLRLVATGQGELGPDRGERDTGRRAQDGTTFPGLRSIYMSGVRAQGPMVGGASAQTGRGGTYPSAPASSSPLGEPSFQPRACPKGEKRHNMRGRRPPAAPACEWRQGDWGGGGGAQVARLSAGRPDMRIWELLLLRMESWVPPFTPLLARDGCRCLKSTAK